MRIRHLVITDSFAGTEQHVCVLANEQARAGHDVEVWGGAASAMRGRLAPGVFHRTSASVASAVRDILGSREVDVVHAHMTKAEVVALLTTTPGRTPVIATRHFAAVRGQSAAGRVGRPLLRRRVTRQIAVSQFVASTIDGTSSVIYAGVDSHPPDERERERTVLVAQRLSPEKRTSQALKAFAASALAEQGWRLELAGRGQEHDGLVAQAARLGLTDYVTFLGFTRELPYRMSRSAILLATAPSEPFGLTVAEAMAHGTPVVATASGGHLETVGRVSSTYLYEPGDATRAGELLRRLADDAQTRSRYGTALRETQLEWFTPERQYRETQVVYEGAMRR